MKAIFYSLILFGCLGCRAEKEWTLTSPDGAVRFVATQVPEGEETTILQYSVYCGDSLVINPSRLGLVMDGIEYGKDARPAGKAVVKTMNEPYELKAGKQLRTVNACREMTIPFEGFQLIVRAYDDGIAFRYAFTQEDDGKQHTITDECIGFK